MYFDLGISCEAYYNHLKLDNSFMEILLSSIEGIKFGISILIQLFICNRWIYGNCCKF